jgi:hypothetical protein
MILLRFWKITFKKTQLPNMECIDHQKRKPVFMPFESLYEWSGSVGIFQECDINVGLKNYQDEMLLHKDHILSTKVLDNLTNFISDFKMTKEYFDPQIKYESVYELPLIFDLFRIANQRYCFREYLVYLLSIKVIEESMIIKNLARSYVLYRKLVLSIMKDIQKHCIKDKSFILDAIFHNEKSIINDFFSLCSKF